MSKRMGDDVAVGHSADHQDGGGAPPERPETEEEGTGPGQSTDDAGGQPLDLKATVTLSGEALAALLEEVKHTRAKTGAALPALPPEPATPLPQRAAPEGARKSDVRTGDRDNKADSQFDGKPDCKPDGKPEAQPNAKSWWTRGSGPPAKR